MTVSLEHLAELRTGKITKHEYVLSYFEDQTEWTVAELAKEMHITPSTARRYVRDLQWGGWLRLSCHHPKTYVRIPTDV